jgi:hypothetical protein
MRKEENEEFESLSGPSIDRSSERYSAGLSHPQFGSSSTPPVDPNTGLPQTVISPGRTSESGERVFEHRRFGERPAPEDAQIVGYKKISFENSRLENLTDAQIFSPVNPAEIQNYNESVGIPSSGSGPYVVGEYALKVDTVERAWKDFGDPSYAASTEVRTKAGDAELIGGSVYAHEGSNPIPVSPNELRSIVAGWENGRDSSAPPPASVSELRTVLESNQSSAQTGWGVDRNGNLTQSQVSSQSVVEHGVFGN